MSITFGSVTKRITIQGVTITIQGVTKATSGTLNIRLVLLISLFHSGMERCSRRSTCLSIQMKRLCRKPWPMLRIISPLATSNEMTYFLGKLDDLLIIFVSRFIVPCFLSHRTFSINVLLVIHPTLEFLARSDNLTHLSGGGHKARFAFSLMYGSLWDTVPR